MPTMGQSKMDNPEKPATRRRKKNLKKHSTICVGHLYMQANTNNVNKTRALPQTTGGKDKLNVVFMRNRKYLLSDILVILTHTLIRCIHPFDNSMSFIM